jgi:3-hydroxyisobutyrate dehydrogenase
MANLAPTANRDNGINATVAVLGVGIMGSAFARRAVAAGLRTIAWDRHRNQVEPLLSSGVQPAESIAEAVGDADVVVTMVPDADAVLSVMKGLGAFAAMKSSATWVQMATIGVEGMEQALHLAAARPEVGFVDAPVTGSKGPAEEGKLVILASGDRERAGPSVQRFFDSIGSQTHWLGDAGQGTRMKLVFNAWIGILIEGVAEVATLAEALGTQPQRFTSLAAGGPVVPPWALAKFDKIVTQRTAETEFPLHWAYKDVLLALSAAGAARPHLPILDRISTVWADAIGDFGSDDLSAIYLALQRRGPS